MQQHAKEGAIFATNTSGIPIESIAQAFNDDTRQRFLGLHFFNPPRIMKLAEIIPNEHTANAVIESVKSFAEDILGKGTVVANDVAGFVANRVGTQSMNDVMYRAEQQGFSITEVDALTGRAIGRPNTGTYGLTDLVGLDIAQTVTEGMRRVPEEQPYFKEVQLSKKLFEAGALGRKTKQGFYKKENKKRLVLDPEKNEYVEPQQPTFDILGQFNKDLAHNLDVIFNATDDAGKFLWETLRNNFYYAAINVPKAAADFKDIDRAIVWGFNWKKGPFQLWDLMGFDRVKDRIKDEIGDLPDWVDKQQGSFYAENESIERITDVSNFIDSEVWDKEDSNLSVANKDQLLLKLQSKNNVITNEFVK